MQRFGRGQPLQPPQPSGPGLGPPRMGGGPPGSRTPNRDHPPSGPFSSSTGLDEFGTGVGLGGGVGSGAANRQYSDEMDGIRVAGDDLHGGPGGTSMSASFPPQPPGAAPPRPQPQGASLGGSEGQLPGHLTAGGVGGGGGLGGGMPGQRMGDARTLKGAGGIPQIEITNDGHETLGGTGMPGVGINGGGRVPPIDGEYAYQNGGTRPPERESD